MISKKDLMLQIIDLECIVDDLLERVDKLEKSKKKTTRSKK